MISCLFAACILMQDPPKQEQPQVNAGQLISKMLGYYNAAESMTGTVMFTQVATGQEQGMLKVRTRFQFQKPALVFVEQIPQNKNVRYMIGSNGKVFAYSPPETAFVKRPGELMVEKVTDPRGRTQDYRSIFAVGAAGLIDRSPVLRIAFGRREDLQFLKDQWATVEYIGEEKIGEQTVHIVGGKWRIDRASASSGNYSMAITPEGELKKFYQEELFRAASNGQSIDLVIKSTWEVDMKLNGTPDPALFKLNIK